MPEDHPDPRPRAGRAELRLRSRAPCAAPLADHRQTPDKPALQRLAPPPSEADIKRRQGLRELAAKKAETKRLRAAAKRNAARNAAMPRSKPQEPAGGLPDLSAEDAP